MFDKQIDSPEGSTNYVNIHVWIECKLAHLSRQIPLCFRAPFTTVLQKLQNYLGEKYKKNQIENKCTNCEILKGTKKEVQLNTLTMQ